jgi:hypothetical protein
MNEMQATISELEIRFIEETLELIEEEFDGIEECSECDYVLTTGAREGVEEAQRIIEGLRNQLHGDFDDNTEYENY